MALCLALSLLVIRQWGLLTTIGVKTTLSQPLSATPLMIVVCDGGNGASTVGCDRKYVYATGGNIGVAWMGAFKA